MAELLSEGNRLTSFGLEEKIECSRNSVHKAIRQLRSSRLVYIHSWIHPGDGNGLAPVFAWKGLRAGLKDTERPPRKPKSQINKDWNLRYRKYRSVMQKIKRGTTPSVWDGLL